MANRKYERYIVADEFGEDGYHQYKDAFASYNRAQSATLYGVTEQGDMTIIMTK